MGCEGTMDIEVGPIEETVQALMEYLVGPLLPLKHSDISKRIPSESQQKSVAEQVHAAAVLYNYYHIKHHQKREFLKFDQFCNLAIMFKPSILHHMKYMRQSDRPIIDDPENQLSLTEKAIMDACTISETLLDASANISSIIKGWPITKVAVLLIDSKRENCFLQFNNGVWSVIEKEISSEVSGIGSESKTNKKRRMLYMNKDDAEGEAGFQQLALSAVKEVAGIITGELVVLEGHVVYSLSRAKTATRFYIVQSTQPISEDSLVPIQDAICSLQGPVVRKSSGSWVITPVVEYYHLLPYAEKISEWFSSIKNGIKGPLCASSLAIVPCTMGTSALISPLTTSTLLDTSAFNEVVYPFLKKTTFTFAHVHSHSWLTHHRQHRHPYHVSTANSFGPTSAAIEPLRILFEHERMDWLRGEGLGYGLLFTSGP